MSTDNDGRKCEVCHSGIYTETRFHDDMDGVLHCNYCDHEVRRYPNIQKIKKEEKKPMLINVSLQMEDLVDAVHSGLDRDQMVEFAKNLDLAVAEMDFTERLIRELVASLLDEIPNTGDGEGEKLRVSALAKLEKLMRVIHKGMEL